MGRRVGRRVSLTSYRFCCCDVVLTVAQLSSPALRASRLELRSSRVGWTAPSPAEKLGRGESSCPLWRWA